MDAPPLPAQRQSDPSGLAVGSLVCGILGFVTCGVTSVPAVILGHISLSRMKSGNDAKRGLAIGGLVTGYLTFAIAAIAVLAGLATPLILRSRQAADREEMISEMRQFGHQILEFDVEFGGPPSDATADDVREATGTDLPLTGEHVLNQLKAFFGPGAELPPVPNSAEGNWIYRPDAGTGVLLISPRISGKRFELNADSSVSISSREEIESTGAILVRPEYRR